MKSEQASTCEEPEEMHCDVAVNTDLTMDDIHLYMNLKNNQMR